MTDTNDAKAAADKAAADKAAADKAEADAKAAAKAAKASVATFPDGSPVLAFPSWDEAAAQAKGLGKHHPEAVGTAVAVVPD